MIEAYRELVTGDNAVTVVMTLGGLMVGWAISSAVNSLRRKAKAQEMLAMAMWRIADAMDKRP